VSLILIILATWVGLSLLAIPILTLLGRAGRTADDVATAHHAQLLERPLESAADPRVARRELVDGTRGLQR
jgi:hypothetical protein